MLCLHQCTHAYCKMWPLRHRQTGETHPERHCVGNEVYKPTYCSRVNLANPICSKGRIIADAAALTFTAILQATHLLSELTPLLGGGGRSGAHLTLNAYLVTLICCEKSHTPVLPHSPPQHRGGMLLYREASLGRGGVKDLFLA